MSTPAPNQPNDLIKFDPQTYLLSYFEELTTTYASQYKYDNVYALSTDTKDSFPKTMAVLENRAGANTFIKLPTRKYNALIPRIRLYRVTYDKNNQIKNQKEFVFKKDSSYNFTDPIAKNNCGIKSMSWKLAGTNPVTAEKQVEVQLELYFDSINAFSGGNYTAMASAFQSGADLDGSSFNFCDGDKTTRNYWSLIFHPKTDKGKYNTFDFRIKAYVGWEDVDPDIVRSMGFTALELADIKKLNYGFFLNLLKHEFKFNEDGSLTLNAYYIASFESSTFNQNFDLLGNMKERIEALKSRSIANLTNVGGSTSNADLTKAVSELSAIGIQITEQELSQYNPTQIEQLNAKLKIAQEVAGDTNKREQYLKCNAVQNDPSLKAVIDNIPSSGVNTGAATAALNQLNTNVLNQATAIVKNRHYSRLVDRIYNGVNSSIFAVFTDPTTVTNWNYWAQNGSSKPALITSKPAGVVGAPTIPAIPTTPPPATTTSTTGASLEQLAQNTLEAYSTGVQQVQFTTIGHIIDAAFGVINLNLDETGQQALKNELKKIKVMLSDLSSDYRVFNPSGGGGQVNQSNMAYIPVDMFFLKAFLIEKIVKLQKDSYPLFSFLKDVVSSLIINALNIKNIYQKDTAKFTNASLASSILYFGNSSDTDPLTQFKSGNNLLPASSLSQNRLSNYYLNYGNRNSHNHYYSYFFIYDKYMKDFSPPQGRANTIIRSNEQNGIYHFTFGQDYGLVKSIDFSRIDIPYTKEAKATGTKTFYLGQFRDIYNANLTMIGNNFYYPGMLLYIKPSIETSIVTSGQVPNFSQITGVGGYYQVLEVDSSITEDGYETKLKTIWQSDGFETNIDTANEDECSKNLANAGYGSSGGVQVDLSALNAQTKSTEIAALEAQIVDYRAQIQDIQGAGANAASDRTRVTALQQDINAIEQQIATLKGP